jgi:hypothetical protein
VLRASFKELLRRRVGIEKVTKENYYASPSRAEAWTQDLLSIKRQHGPVRPGGRQQHETRYQGPTQKTQPVTRTAVCLPQWQRAVSYILRFSGLPVYPPTTQTVPHSLQFGNQEIRHKLMRPRVNRLCFPLHKATETQALQRNDRLGPVGKQHSLKALHPRLSLRLCWRFKPSGMWIRSTLNTKDLNLFQTSGTTNPKTRRHVREWTNPLSTPFHPTRPSKTKLCTPLSTYASTAGKQQGVHLYTCQEQRTNSYSTGHSPSREANSSSARQEIPQIFRNPNVHYHAHNSPPLVPIPNQVNPVRACPLYFSVVHLNTILPSTPKSCRWSISITFPPTQSLQAGLLSATRATYPPISLSSWSDWEIKLCSCY